MEASYLANGRFLHDLDSWTADDATYSAGDGDEQYGVAVLAVGGSIAQDFSVTGAKLFTVHLAVKATATLTAGQATLAITDGNGNAIQSFAEAERTMYALLSDVNIIPTDARPTHIPIR